MIIERKSVISGVVRQRNIPVNPRHIAEYEAGYGPLYQVAPYLSSEDREFIISGITGDEWQNAFSKEIAKIVQDKF